MVEELSFTLYPSETSSACRVVVRENRAKVIETQIDLFMSIAIDTRFRSAISVLKHFIFIEVFTDVLILESFAHF